MKPDVAIGGLPCPPWSRQRCKKGGTASIGAAHQHPQFSVAFMMSALYLDVRSPFTFWIEEVDTFANKTPQGGDSPLAELMRICVAKGYVCRAIIIEHQAFVRVPLRRCFLLGILRKAGHAEAADWVVLRINECLRHRKLFPPTPISEIVDLYLFAEKSRRARDKAFV